MNFYWSRITLPLCILFYSLVFFGCSTTGDPTIPGEETSSLINNPDAPPMNPGRKIFGVYAFEFDEQAVSLSRVDVRSLAAHYDVTGFTTPPSCGGQGCLTYNIINWDAAKRVLTLNATIENPTYLTAYDVRLVFQKFVNRRLLNADSYTDNYDPAGAINPFIAFAKSSTTRQFSPTPAKVTEKVKIFWPVTGSGFIFNIVEASWPGHCYEPYEINNITVSGNITPANPTITISCDVLDWQNDINWVRVDTTPLTGGYTYLTNVGGNTWAGTISNTNGAPPGDYFCWISSHSTDPNGLGFDRIYGPVYAKIRLDKWRAKGSHLLPGQCSSDIGVIGSASGSPLDSHVLIAGDAPGGQPCDGIDKYTANYGASALYKSLVNLDPNNNTYQPWPIVRIDATYDGASGWSNSNSQKYNQVGYTPGAGIGNQYIYSNIDRNKNFNSQWPNDHRHFVVPLPLSPDYWPVDVCDDFNRYQYGLFVDGVNDARPMGLEGAPGCSYRNFDVIYYTSLAGFIGPGAGQIEPGNEIGGIDAWPIAYNTVRFFILEHGSDLAVEAFDIVNTQAGFGLDAVQWVFRIGIPAGFEPVDCELLPANKDFTPNPNQPTLCVLVSAPGGGGDVLFFNANNGNLINSLSGLGFNLPNPPIQNNPLYIDNDDGHFEMHVVETGPQVTIFNWI